MAPQIIGGIIMLVASVIVLVIGYQIRFQRRLSLIAGLEVSRVRDPDGLARWIGTGLLAVGGLELLLGLVLLVRWAPVVPLILAYVGVSIAGMVLLLTRMRRYFG